MSDDQQAATTTDSKHTGSDAGTPNVGDRSAGGNASGASSGSDASATHAGTTPAQGADLSGGGTSDTE